MKVFRGVTHFVLCIIPRTALTWLESRRSHAGLSPLGLRFDGRVDREAMLGSMQFVDSRLLLGEFDDNMKRCGALSGEAQRLRMILRK